MNEHVKDTGRSAREDEILIRAFQGGDKAVFDELVLKHQHKLFNLCYRLSGDYQEANDAAQETFIKVYESLKRFRFESAFSTWLYRITVNTCKNKFKSSAYRQKKKTVSLDNPGLSQDDDSALEIRDDTYSPAKELERKERMRAIEEAIRRLPPEQKTVVTLRDIEGFSYEEIVRITGTALGTVKSRLARARLDLRKRLRSVMQDELR
jgi:RNA polymerase sigma-70 factor (ECF subfamily)